MVCLLKATGVRFGGVERYPREFEQMMLVFYVLDLIGTLVRSAMVLMTVSVLRLCVSW